MRGLAQVKPWGYLGDVGQAVNDYAKENGYSVVREIGGHGVGVDFHEEPWVSFVTKKGRDDDGSGYDVTIEQMINLGRADIYEDDSNGWTIRTDDGSPSAQWEIQVLVTETGYELIAW